jgi:hypothetical protein
VLYSVRNLVLLSNIITYILINHHFLKNLLITKFLSTLHSFKACRTWLDFFHFCVSDAYLRKLKYCCVEPFTCNIVPDQCSILTYILYIYAIFLREDWAYPWYYSCGTHDSLFKIITAWNLPLFLKYCWNLFLRL